MQFSFDASGIDTSDDRGGFEPLPQGKYNAMVIESAVKDSKAGGQYVELVCPVLDG